MLGSQIAIELADRRKTNAMFLRYSHLDREKGEGAMERLHGLLSRKNGENPVAQSGSE